MSTTPAPNAPDPGAPADVAPDPAAKRSSWSLGLRILSGVAFVPLLAFLVAVGGFAFVAFVALQVSAGLLEFYAMMRGRGLRPYRRLGIATALAVLWICVHPQMPYVAFLATAAILLVLGLELRRPEATRRVEDIAVTWFGLSTAADAYARLLEARPELGDRPFLLLWEQGRLVPVAAA